MPTTERHDHWQGIYSTKRDDEVSWFQPVPAVSLELIDRCQLKGDARVIDVGAGASRVVDGLLARGCLPTVLDIAGAALVVSRQRLGDVAERVSWVEQDVTSFSPTTPFDLWHDRAVFHFLTLAEDRAAYRTALSAAVRPGGHAIVATFAPDGPEKCSGLPVVRYAPDELAAELGDGFVLVDQLRHEHVTPSGRVQAFTFVVLQRKDSPAGPDGSDR